MGLTPGPAECSPLLEPLWCDRIWGGRAVFPDPLEPRCLAELLAGHMWSRSTRDTAAQHMLGSGDTVWKAGLRAHGEFLMLIRG